MHWWIIAITAIATLGQGLWTLRRGDRERKAIGRRSTLTAAGVWVFYLLYTVEAALLAMFGVSPMGVSHSVAWTAGGAVFVLGVALCAWGMANMRFFDCISGTESRRLITAGAYRFSRNPQNTGWGLALAGLALAGASWASMIMAVLFWVFFVWYARREERHLRRVFGESYEQYCQTTARFLGWNRKPAAQDVVDGDAAGATR